VNIDDRIPNLKEASNSLRIARVVELVASAKVGSTAAFTELYRMYSSSIFRRILSITGNREDAEDALQESFLKAFTCIGQFQGTAQFYTWLMRIAINSSLMVLRKKRIRREGPFTIASESDCGSTEFEVPDTQPSPEQRCDQVQRYRSVLRSIERLPPKLKIVAELRLLSDLSASEAGQTLGLSESVIKTRLFRARKRLASHSTPGARRDRHPFNSGCATAELEPAA
jgi:RNA polymerase sigma-70 factor, ECF subfamily